MVRRCGHGLGYELVQTAKAEYGGNRPDDHDTGKNARSPDRSLPAAYWSSRLGMFVGQVDTRENG